MKVVFSGVGEAAKKRELEECFPREMRWILPLLLLTPLSSGGGNDSR